MLTGLQVHKQTVALPLQNVLVLQNVLCHLPVVRHPVDSSPHRTQLTCQASLLNFMQHDGTASHAWQVFPCCVHYGSPGLLGVPCPMQPPSTASATAPSLHKLPFATKGLMPPRLTIQCLPDIDMRQLTQLPSCCAQHTRAEAKGPGCHWPALPACLLTQCSPACPCCMQHTDAHLGCWAWLAAMASQRFPQGSCRRRLMRCPTPQRCTPGCPPSPWDWLQGGGGGLLARERTPK